MNNSLRKLSFIINPISGSGKGIRVKKALESSSLFKSFDVSIQTTSYAGEATKMAQKAVTDSVEIIVAVGGDGTVNEIGSALIGSQTVMGIIPTGSGNGLARHLGISRKIEKAIQTLIRGEVKTIDTGFINNRTFLNVTGTGLDAKVSREFAESKNRGWFNYLKIMIMAGSNIIESDYNLKYNGIERTVKASMVSAANSTQFGNNARIAPLANIEDGKIDICISK